MERSGFRILGLDPGSRHTGYGLIDRQGARLIHIASGTISPPSRLPFSERLCVLHNGIAEQIATHRPDHVAVEDLFHALNVRSVLQLAQARGVLLLAAGQAGVPVSSYPPREVKKTVSGSGAAEKSQLAWMVERLLAMSAAPDSPDAADALAVAICHANQPLSRGARTTLRRGPSARSRG